MKKVFLGFLKYGAVAFMAFCCGIGIIFALIVMGIAYFDQQCMERCKAKNFTESDCMDICGI